MTVLRALAWGVAGWLAAAVAWAQPVPPTPRQLTVFGGTAVNAGAGTMVPAPAPAAVRGSGFEENHG